MTVVQIMENIMEEKEWIFSGIGVLAITAISSIFKKKRSGGNATSINEQKNNEVSVYGSNNTLGNKQNITNNYFYGNDVEKQEKSWFSKRFYIFLANLNKTRKRDEKEYTIEYISSLLGLDSVEELKKYLMQGKEPNDEFKRKFVDVFGVNEDWMVYNRGEYSFAPNIIFSGNNPMDILRNEELKSIERFILVVGDIEGKRKACVIRKKGHLCYEVYPKFFIFDSCVGKTGVKNLVELYRFLREAKKIEKLDSVVYKATEEQMKGLIQGKFYPKIVELFESYTDFIEDFLSISVEAISQNQKYWDNEFISVQKIIAENIKSFDECNQQNDLMRIEGNVESLDNKDSKPSNDIDMFDYSTPFFSFRFGKAFPGVRGMKEYTTPKECIERLEILLREPLNGKKLHGPIWWFRGGSNLDINTFKKISDEKFLINYQEIKVKRVVAYAASEYYKSFVYVETFGEEPTGLYEYYEDIVKEWEERFGYYYEEYAVYQGKNIRREEFDDGSAEIDGKIVDLKGQAKLRTRYITPYNFVVCAQFNPINDSMYDQKMTNLLNGILRGQNDVEDIVAFVESMPRNRDDL